LTKNRKFSLPLSCLQLSVGATPVEFMETLYGSWN